MLILYAKEVQMETWMMLNSIKSCGVKLIEI